MVVPDYELLDTTGFSFTEMAITVSVLKANYGDGYGAGALNGHAQGLRSWTIEVALLPDLDEFLIFPADSSEGETRANYLWDLFLRSKVAGNRPFRFREHKDGQEFFAEFVEDTLSFQMFTAKLFSTGLQIKQRRVRDFESPSPPSDNPDQI